MVFFLFQIGFQDISFGGRASLIQNSTCVKIPTAVEANCWEICPPKSFKGKTYWRHTPSSMYLQRHKASISGPYQCIIIEYMCTHGKSLFSCSNVGWFMNSWIYHYSSLIMLFPTNDRWSLPTIWTIGAQVLMITHSHYHWLLLIGWCFPTIVGHYPLPTIKRI